MSLVETKQDCLNELFKTVRTTRRISELVRQRVPDRRTGDRKRPTAVCVESTARYDELVSVCGTQTKPRSDVRGCDEMVGEVPRFLTVKTAIHHDTHLYCNWPHRVPQKSAQTPKIWLRSNGGVTVARNFLRLFRRQISVVCCFFSKVTLPVRIHTKLA